MIQVETYDKDGRELSSGLFPLSGALETLQRLTWLAHRAKNPNFLPNYWESHKAIEESLLAGNRIGLDLEFADWRFEIKRSN